MKSFIEAYKIYNFFQESVPDEHYKLCWNKVGSLWQVVSIYPHEVNHSVFRSLEIVL